MSARAACISKAIVVDGAERSGVVCVGERVAAKKNLPLVLAFHGRGGNAREMATGTRIHEEWPEAIVAYLDGLPGNPAPYDPQGLRSGWQINPGDLGDRDLHFVDAALARLSQRYSIDPGRVYAVGHSNGARFAGILWALRAKRFAAFAFSAAQADTLIEKAAPRSAFMGMGRKDELIPFEWQYRSIDYAKALLGTDSSKASEFGDVRSEPGKGGTELMTYIHPGGHAWPQGQTKLIVDFFKRHGMPVSAVGSAGP